MMNEHAKLKVIIIAGPTASGKTSLAISLASRFGGEIISADSMQVYRGMDVGTAKPTAEEQLQIKHHLIDVVDPDDEFNAARYISMASPEVMNIHNKNKVCFVVGGTGLYIKSLLSGLIPCQPADMNFRETLRKQLKMNGSFELYQRLVQTDPDYSAKIHPNDVIRIIRALEIKHLTGLCPSALAKEHRMKDNFFQSIKFCLDMDREKLYKIINQRAVNMIQDGLVEETDRLLKKGYSPDLQPIKSIGYRHMVAYLKGAWSLDEAIHYLQRDTRRYAKRQTTWFKADPEMIMAGSDQMDLISKKIEAFLENEAVFAQ
jgi:tRNA dimethylallyltransferase